MAAHASLLVACTKYCHCIYLLILESAAAKEELQKVSVRVSPHCLSWISRHSAVKQSRHSAVKQSRHSAVKQSRHSAVKQSRHSAVKQSRHSAVKQSRHSAVKQRHLLINDSVIGWPKITHDIVYSTCILHILPCQILCYALCGDCFVRFSDCQYTLESLTQSQNANAISKQTQSLNL